MWKINTFLQKSASVYWLGNALWYDRGATNEYGMGRYGWERREGCGIRGLTWIGNAGNKVRLQLWVLHLWSERWLQKPQRSNWDTQMWQPHIHHQYWNLPTSNCKINQTPPPSSHSGLLSLSFECRVIIHHPSSVSPSWLAGVRQITYSSHTRMQAHMHAHTFTWANENSAASRAV